MADKRLEAGTMPSSLDELGAPMPLDAKHVAITVMPGDVVACTPAEAAVSAIPSSATRSASPAT